MKNLIGLMFLVATWAAADGPADNQPENVRRVPPPGIEVKAADREALDQKLDAVQRAMQELAADPLLPDVEVFHKAVRDCLKHREFQKPAELKWAREQLDLALERAAQLKQGASPWLRQTGLVVRGFRSNLDGSVQPYGLVVPDSYDFDARKPHRLDFWFHGRGERTTEVAFIRQRMTNKGQITPPDTLVLHPYARYSNANKFAGEIDCLEALEHVRQSYRVDPDRILVRGFSMGGAACWQFAVHYGDRFAAANPGAGFSETKEFLDFFQGEKVDPPWYEKKLWHWYDCTDYALNLFNLPTVAYSGEIDRQKQAADIMAKALRAEGMELTHIIGPKTGHKIHPDSKIEIEKRMSAFAKAGRNRFPLHIKFTTYTLRYNRMHWLTVDRLREHWEKAVIEIEFKTTGGGAPGIYVSNVRNIDAFTVRLPREQAGWKGMVKFLHIDGYQIPLRWTNTPDVSLLQVGRKGKTWKIRPLNEAGLQKRHRLQGPIDDAFMDAFMFVKAAQAEPDPWTASAFKHAVTHWRQQFRGDVRIIEDEKIADEAREHNLVLWGSPSSNAYLKKILPRLPIQWDEKKITVGDRVFDAAHHRLIMIYPNPLNSRRYVVLNSGFTYREYDYLNNARQVPKLPDWAVVDTRHPATSQYPGKIVHAGFFDEHWQLKKGP